MPTFFFSAEQRAFLERTALERGVSVDRVIANLVDREMAVSASIEAETPITTYSRYSRKSRKTRFVPQVIVSQADLEPALEDPDETSSLWEDDIPTFRRSAQR